MSEELPEPPARVRGALRRPAIGTLLRSPRGPRSLEPVVDWNRWQALQGGTWFNTAAKNVGTATGAGTLFGGAGTAIFLAAPHAPGAEAVPLFGVTFASVGVYAFICAVAGAMHRPKLRAADAWLAEASHARLDAWLRTEYGITPKGKIFNNDVVAYAVNSSGVVGQTFADSTGKFHRVQRVEEDGPLELVADPYSPASKPALPAKSKRTPQSVPPAEMLPEPPKPLDPILAFSRADRPAVQQALTLAEALAESAELTTEQRYEVERAQKVLAEVIGLAGKLANLSATKKRAAFADLMASVIATTANLKQVAEQRDAALVRDVEVLRNYTAALSPKVSPFSLPAAKSKADSQR